MTQPWVAERVVSAEAARALIEAQFPALAPATVAPFGVGWDNTAYLVNDRYVFRFPRRPIAVGLLATEARLVPVIAPRVPLAVPVPTHAGRPDRGYPWPFAGYEMLAGQPADRARLDDRGRQAAAEPLARFLRALHAIPTAGLDAPGDTIGRLALADRAPQTSARLEQLGRLGLIADVAPLLRLHGQVAELRAPRETILAHGDLYARHLLVGADGGVTGVIDWGDVHVGDPAVDLMVAHGFLPRSAHAVFCDAYGAIDDQTWELARLRALHHAAAVTLYGHDVGDADLLREGVTALAHLEAALVG